MAQEKQAFRQTLSDAKKRLSAADKKYQSALSHYEEVLEESGDEEYAGLWKMCTILLSSWL